MNIKHLVMVSILVASSVGTITTSAAVKEVDKQEIASVEKRDLLKYKGMRFGPRYMKSYCSYSDYRGNTVLIPQDNFEKRRCAEYVAKR